MCKKYYPNFPIFISPHPNSLLEQGLPSPWFASWAPFFWRPTSRWWQGESRCCIWKSSTSAYLFLKMPSERKRGLPWGDAIAKAAGPFRKCPGTQRCQLQVWLVGAWTRGQNQNAKIAITEFHDSCQHVSHPPERCIKVYGCNYKK